MNFKTLSMCAIAMMTVLAGCKGKNAGNTACESSCNENCEKNCGECCEDADVFTATDNTTIKMFCIKHGSIRMQIGDKWLYVDPVTTGAMPETDYSQFPKADFILVTHNHYDHLDTLAISQLSKEGTQVIADKTSCESLGFGTAMANGDTITIGDSWSLEAVPAYNYSEEKLAFHPQGRDNGYILTVGGTRIYIAGDTEDIPEMENIKNIDVAFMPCNLPFTMTPEQLAKAAGTVQPKVLFPYHYGDTDMQRVDSLLQNSGIDVRIRQYQ